MKWGKVSLVIFGAVVLTALGIDAADTMVSREGTLLSQVVRSTGSGCPNGMVAVDYIPGVSCVDAYEAAAGSDCPIQDPGNILDSSQNLEAGGCTAISEVDHTPWRFITRDQAMQVCARSGKRLPSSGEWYALALGMNAVETSCNVASGRVSASGAFAECRAPSGVYDLVGNVWEWVDDDVIDGTYQGRALPESGYVAQVDGDGMATVSTSTESDLHGKDYFWSKDSGAHGVIRGGFYDSGSDAGLFAVHADTPPNTAVAGIGFRCVK